MNGTSLVSNPVPLERIHLGMEGGGVDLADEDVESSADGVDGMVINAADVEVSSGGHN
jgi:hypothetical protein